MLLYSGTNLNYHKLPQTKTVNALRNNTSKSNYSANISSDSFSAIKFFICRGWVLLADCVRCGPAAALSDRNLSNSELLRVLTSSLVCTVYCGLAACNAACLPIRSSSSSLDWNEVKAGRFYDVNNMILKRRT